MSSWDNVYDRELQNQATDETDEGTIWFSENNAEETVRKHLDKLHEAGLINRGCADSDTLSDSQAARFLDLGTGNGHMLFELREIDDEGCCWNGELVGVDYSQGSVQLARRIAEQKYDGEPSNSCQFRFEHWDLLNDSPGAWLADGFDVVLDKGTFDAISLMEHGGSTDHPCQTYQQKVAPLIKPNGFLFVTSCNWTKTELLHLLLPSEGDFILFDEAKYPIFTFGGQTGQSIVTIILRKKCR